MSNSWYSIEAKAGEAEVYIYDEIGLWGVSAKDFAADLRTVGNVSVINLRVNTPGGQVVHGLAMFNLLRDHPADVHVHIDGAAYSMGSYLAMVAVHGGTVRMAENALMMVHNPRMPAFGDAAEMRKTADVLDKYRESMVGAYLLKTGMGRDELLALLDAETWMTATEALERGFIDEITGAMEIAAHADLGRFEYQNVPAGVSRPVAADKTAKATFKIEPVLKAADLVAAIRTAIKSGDVTPDDPVSTPPADAGTTQEGDTTMSGKDDVSANADEVKAAKAKAVADERQRVADIKAVFAPFGDTHGAVMNAAIDEGLSVGEAQAKALEAVAKTVEPASSGDARIEAGADARDKFRSAATNTIAVRAGVGKDDGANDLRGYSMLELARRSLDVSNVASGGRNKLDVVGMAFTHSSSDFANILADVANKSMLRGFSEAEETFQKWTVRGEMSDFKQISRVGTSEFQSLRKVDENGEYKHRTMSDYAETNQLATYGELFGISRQAIINDDLRAFTEIPRKMGRAAIRTVGDLAYAVLTSNPLMGDGVALFATGHKNLNGTGAGISTAAIQAIRAAMAKQKGRTEEVTALNIRPSLLLCPVAIEGTALQVRDSETEIADGQNNSKRPNIVRGTFEVISDARLDVANAADWYMTGAPGQYDTVEVAYLDGNDQPYLEQQEGWSVDGVEFKVRIDAGCAPLEFAAMYKQVGA